LGVQPWPGTNSRLPELDLHPVLNKTNEKAAINTINSFDMGRD